MSPIVLYKPVKMSAGLGHPIPKPFYTNAVESMNRLLSDETDHKPQSMPSFCDKAKSIAVRQHRDVERAIVGLLHTCCIQKSRICR